jgi:hypothetical protein
MMLFEMPYFARQIEKSLEKFDKIMGNNISAGGKYDQVKLMLEKSLREKESFMIATTQEARLGMTVLSLEPNMIGQMLQSNRLLDFFETALKVSERLAKPLLGLYYRQFYAFENDTANKMYISELLKKLTREYQGRNPMVIKAKENSGIIDGKLHELLTQYGDTDIKEIKRDLYLNEEDEFYQKLRLIKLIEEVKKLKNGESNPPLFQQIYENRDVSATQTRNIGEESVSILLDKCKSANVNIFTDANIFTEWMNFILKAVGDPRSPQTQYAWDRIGLDLKNWLISTLSQGDLIEFLFSITDGQGDEIYQYRREFWMQYVKYVRFAKIMVSKDGIKLLRRTNPAFCERFAQNPITYSTIDEERSCIYMDFGSFKVIEGTHNATIRLYSDCPINIAASSYTYTDFYRPTQVSSLIIQEKKHLHSDKYSWQDSMRNSMNQKLGAKVSLSDILLPKDSRNIARIEDYLLQHSKRQIEVFLK